MEKNDYLTFRAYNILFFLVFSAGIVLSMLNPSLTETWVIISFLGYIPGFIIYRYIAPALIESNFLRLKRSNGTSRSHRFRKNKNAIPAIQKERLEFYYSEGMDDEDILFFRKQMAKSKQQILSIEKLLKQSTKLNVIAKRYDLLPILKDYFKAICDHPKRMNEAEAFLYSYLPTFLEITEKFIEIQSHVSKSKMTYQTLNRSLETLEALCQNIQRSYEIFMENDIEDIGINLQLIEERMQKEQDLLTGFQKDTDLNVPDMKKWLNDPDKELEQILINAHQQDKSLSHKNLDNFDEF